MPTCALAEADHLGRQTADDLLAHGAEHILSALRKVATDHT